MTGGVSPEDQRIAVAIAEAYLAVLSGGSCEQLRQCLGRPAEQLLMGEDRRPYLITAVGLQCPSGGLHLYVGVSSGDWDHSAPVVRSTTVPIGGAEGCRWGPGDGSPTSER